MFGRILSNIYGFFVKKRNTEYDNKEDIFKCRIPVISVGNLSVGGTGKTPFVQMLAKYFISKGFKPGIVGKGYKRRSKGEIIVGDGQKVLTSAHEGGDEMVLLADSLNVPVIAHDSKTEAAKSMQEKFDVDLLIVDDGFQHRGLYRNLDIVLIDKETHDKPLLLPTGRLREPIESLKRADVVCLTGSFKLDDNFNEHISEDTVKIRVKTVQANPYTLANKQQIKIRDAKKSPIKVIAFAGIAKPERFYNMLNESGFVIVKSLPFSDHHDYKKNDIDMLVKVCKTENCTDLATSEKDAAKLSEFTDILTSNGIRCLVFPIALTIIEGKMEFFKMIGNKINRNIYNKRYRNDN